MHHLLGAFHRQLLPCAFYWLDVGEEPVVSKAVFVLFGDADTRPFVAAALINSGYAEEIVMGQHETSSLGPQIAPGHVVYKRVMMHRGVPEDRIRILRSGVSNTMNESEILRDYLASNYEQATWYCGRLVAALLAWQVFLRHRTVTSKGMESAQTV